MLLGWKLDGIISNEAINLFKNIYIKDKKKITHNEWSLLDDERFTLRELFNDLEDVVEYYNDNIEDDEENNEGN